MPFLRVQGAASSIIEKIIEKLCVCAEQVGLNQLTYGVGRLSRIQLTNLITLGVRMLVERYIRALARKRNLRILLDWNPHKTSAVNRIGQISTSRLSLLGLLSKYFHINLLKTRAKSKVSMISSTHLPAMGSLRSEWVLTNVVVTKVKPLEKKNHVASIDPTDFDMPFVEWYVPLLFTYKLEDNSNDVYENAVKRIKDGLQKVLVPIFPWAGRWVEVAGGMGRQLLCDDGGIPFIEAYVDQAMGSVVEHSAHFQPVLELQGWEAVG
jgi:hypothetical protein